MATLGALTIPLNPPGAVTYSASSGGFTGEGTNQDGVVLLDGTAKTNANGAQANQTNLQHRGVFLFIVPGAFGGSASTIKITIQAVDPVSNTTIDLLQSAALAANTAVTMTVYPTVAASANVAVANVLPKTWRIVANATNWGSGGGSYVGVYASLVS